MKICRYDPSLSSLWDEFVGRSRNSTFLFRRGYMDYHADRFEDCSLMAYSDSGKLLAMLPADVTADGTLHSHRGLTYGGWILPPAHLDGADLLHIFEQTLLWARAEGLGAISYKPLPDIFACIPSQEDRYALFRLGAQIDCANLSSAVDLLDPRPFNTLQRRLLRKARALCPQPEIVVSPSAGDYDVGQFWVMLAACLAERHGAVPVHSLAELQLLRDRFPANIRIYMVTMPGSGIPAAGVCIFESERVAHCQYICTTPEGRGLNLLPLLFHHLIGRVYSPALNPAATQRYFDFGTSNESSGRILNEGLLRQKASFGGTGVIFPRYHLSL